MSVVGRLCSLQRMSKFTGTVTCCNIGSAWAFFCTFLIAPSRLGIIGSVENLLSVVRLMCSSLLATCPSPYMQARLRNVTSFFLKAIPWTVTVWLFVAATVERGSRTVWGLRQRFKLLMSAPRYHLNESLHLIISYVQANRESAWFECRLDRIACADRLEHDGSRMFLTRIWLARRAGVLATA